MPAACSVNLAKLHKRTPELGKQFGKLKQPEPHPLFRIIRGKVRGWEKV
jgi:hypothetical protein